MNSIAIPAVKNLKKDDSETFASGIDNLEKVHIGGADQWILIRSQNINNPLLLFLHGGPGTAQISFAPKFQSELEKSFTVVNWDQRGSGKSFTKSVSKSSMNISQFVHDTHELSELLLKRFNQKKLYLAAHSWGSVFGLKTVQQYPGLFSAYIGIGQVVDMQQTARILCKYNYDAAQKNRNTKAFKQLGGAGNILREGTTRDALLHIKWLEKFGGIFSKPSFKKSVIRTLLFSKEYSLLDKLKYKSGTYFSFNALFNELIKVNLFKEVPEVGTPVYFCVGCHDYNTPFMLTEQYYKVLKAPSKKIIWFGQSGHAPQFEEPDKFAAVMASTVLNETLKR